MIYSFDIFDTVLTRKTFRPGDIHLLVAQDLIAEKLWADSVVEWRNSREAAERAARRAALAEEISIDDIKVELEAAYGAALASRAIELELQRELAETVGISSTLARLNELVGEGRRVIYVSDMYLPRRLILSMLDKVGAPAAPLFLSSEIGTTKYSGNLFKYVAEHFRTPLSTIKHTGDHADADYKVPGRLGVATTLFKGSRPTLLETQIYQRLVDGSPLLATTLSGAMRAARLKLTPEFHPKGYLTRLGTQEGALVHIGFVLWLVHQIAELGATKVSFLARDGYLPAKIFEVLRSKLTKTLSAATYTYASRQSLHLASLTPPPTAEDLLWIMLATQSLTFKEWLFRLGLERAELQGLQGGETEIPREDDAFAHCKDQCLQLLQSREFMALVAQKARAARELARDYLRPRISPDNDDVAIVDIGWNGRMQSSMARILSPSEPNLGKLHGLYLGLLRAPDGNFGSYKAWLFDLRTEARPYCASHFQLFETLFAAPHETTYGYRRNGEGEVMPTLAAQDVKTAVWSELIAFQDSILDISADIRCGQDEMIRAEPEIRALCRNAIAIMFRAPSADHALAFSEAEFSADQTNLQRERLIHTLSWMQQYRCLFDGRFKLSANHWREGQLALADAPLLRVMYRVKATARLWIKGELRLKDILKRIKYSLRRA